MKVMSSSLQREISPPENSEDVDNALEVLSRLKPVELRSEWSRVFKDKIPPLTSDLILRSLSYELQVRRFGGLKSSSIKILSSFDKADDDNKSSYNEAQTKLTKGTRLVREWNGCTHSIEVIDTGFLFEGTVYKSLSQIACRITGAHWSGPRFFGLSKNGKGLK